MPRRGEDGSGSSSPPPAAPRAMAPPAGPRKNAPLADRIRPQTLDELVGQEEVLGEGRPLRRALEADRLPSIILWGPPGSGKTTLAHVVRQRTSAHFESLSAVLSGVKELREALHRAEDRLAQQGRRTDPLHRRDPSLQQGAAGRAAQPRRVRRRDPHRRHHREPVVRGQRGAPLALPGRRPQAARRRPARIGAPARPRRHGARPGRALPRGRRRRARLPGRRRRTATRARRSTCSRWRSPTPRPRTTAGGR